MTVKSLSAHTTRKLGSDLAKKILRGKIKTKPGQALIIGLSGGLGAGKTTFIQAFAKGLGAKQRFTSPTFLIMRSYQVRKKKFERIFHIDTYRLRRTHELVPLNFKKIIRNPKNIILIEWAEKIKSVLPKKMIWLNLRHGRKSNERFIKINL